MLHEVQANLAGRQLHEEASQQRRPELLVSQLLGLRKTRSASSAVAEDTKSVGKVACKDGRRAAVRSAKRRIIFVPLEPIVREEPIWVREERKFEEPQQPEPEPERVEPELAMIAEKATEQEQREFVRSFVTEYIAKNGETVDEFFIHWIPYYYPEIDRELIRRAVAAMVKSGRLKVSRKDRVDGVCFLVPA